MSLPERPFLHLPADINSAMGYRRPCQERVVQKENRLRLATSSKHRTIMVDDYESVTASHYVKRTQPSLLLLTPQDPSGDVSMTESLVLTVCFNTLSLLSTWKD
jgi:hypothetical protein